MPILSEDHLRWAVIEYIRYFNACRLHQGLDQVIPIAACTPSFTGCSTCSPQRVDAYFYVFAARRWRPIS